ncbi:cytochrome c oxidase assembly protein [Pseudomonas sp. gcc21]|uniref:cytochrome c oxidase assembly protein n=1 Tax=Pseudomonas sp. gcc21 TaxID=2726989 RepID=UPI001451A10D|nr:cytochrome c oxidase assembly protein [Pseudomonas sp. gcc21]QJD57502.1 cytochrome c oxidase assembly protein [Pseudomonas sp. gcc21]
MRAIREMWPLTLGFLLLASFWLGPLPAMSRTAFSAHMLLHLGIVALVAPLLALGLSRAGVQLDGMRNLRGWAILAFSVEMIVVWGWHAPVLHEAAARHVSVFVVQQLSFLLAGLAVWLLGFAARSKAAASATVIGFFFSFVHMTMLGMLLILAPALIYPADLCLGAFGFEQLEDQRFGGVLMAAWGGLVYMAGGVVFGARLLLREEPDDSSAAA